jgi:hypothetical protein
MGKSPFWEAHKFLKYEKNSSSVSNPRDHYRVQKTTTLHPILCLLNPIHTKSYPVSAEFNPY